MAAFYILARIKKHEQGFVKIPPGGTLRKVNNEGRIHEMLLLFWQIYIIIFLVKRIYPSKIFFT